MARARIGQRAASGEERACRRTHGDVALQDRVHEVLRAMQVGVGEPGSADVDQIIAERALEDVVDAAVLDLCVGDADAVRADRELPVSPSCPPPSG